MTVSPKGNDQRSSQSQLLNLYDDMVYAMATGNSEFEQHETTTLAPVLYKTMELIAKSKTYTILYILTDGDLGSITRDSQSVIDASRFPMSISAIGVGNRECPLLEFFDNNLFERIYDNFSFTKFIYYKKAEEDLGRAVEMPQPLTADEMKNTKSKKYEKYMEMLQKY